MNFLKSASLVALAAALLTLANPQSTHAQNVTDQWLLHPPPDSWPGYHGDYSGRRHSSLTQITPDNVKDLGLAWAFQTSQNASIKSTPILADGILYFTVPDNVWAVDARSGHQLWHYQYPPNKGDHIGHRGVAIYKDWIFFTSPDAHLLSLNAKDGTVRWKIQLADVNKGYWATGAPLIVDGPDVVGNGEVEDAVGQDWGRLDAGVLTSLDNSLNSHVAAH